ncbi:MAG: DUF2207 domain-containing protein [Huintestinicola sp.]
MYFRQQGSGTCVFQISCRMENAVKLYSDVGGFFWDLTAETVISDIEMLTATLAVPEGAAEREFTERVKSKDIARYSRIRLKHRLIVSAAAGIILVSP